MKSFITAILLVCTAIQLNAQCLTDCVWPGDANNNGIVNNVDFIFTGVALTEVGIARAIAEQGIAWEAKTSTDWGVQFGSFGIDFKHADATGEGWVDGTDLQAGQNVYYDTTNASYQGDFGAVIPGNDLFLVFDKDSALAGDTITIGVHLGSASNPINNLHGIAFTINLDTSKIVEAETTIDFHGGWLGTPLTDLYTTLYYKPNVDARFADFAATRGNYGAVSGFGEIAQIIVVTEIDLDGKGNGLIAAIPFNFENVIGLDSTGLDKLITCKNDSVDILDAYPTGVRNRTNAFEFKVYPNPNTGSFMLDFDKEPEVFFITNTLGQRVDFERNGNSLKVIENNSGLYFINAYVDGVLYSEKFFVRKN